MKKRILFLCTGNSCRSQMAEAWAGHLHGQWLEPWSAGIEKHGMNPLAVQVMEEAGVDMDGQSSKLIGELPEGEFDLVVTVCDNARASCPVFPGTARVVHRAFDDPPRLAADAVDEAQALAQYRRVRDEIREWIEGELPGLIRSS